MKNAYDSRSVFTISNGEYSREEEEEKRKREAPSCEGEYSNSVVDEEDFGKFAFLMDTHRELRFSNGNDLITELKRIVNKCETLEELKDLHRFLLLLLKSEPIYETISKPGIVEYLISEKYKDVYRK